MRKHKKTLDAHALGVLLIEELSKPPAGIDDATVKKLIADGADLTIEDNFQDTALFLATAWGKSDIVKLLLDAGANVNHKNQVGDTPLLYAVCHQHDDTVKVLLTAANIDVNLHGVSSWPALLKAAEWGNQSMVAQLLEAGADEKITNSAGENVCDVAVANDFHDLAKYIQSWGTKESHARQKMKKDALDRTVDIIKNGTKEPIPRKRFGGFKR